VSELREVLALVTLTAGLLTSATARGAGLYFADRGVRPAARAGAFVAGADDLGAIAYNPAGFYDAGSQFLLDAGWLHFTSDYTRQGLVQQVDPNTGQPTGTKFLQTYPTVHGSSPVLPIPTIAGSFQPDKQWVVAIGAWAPYSAIASYPEVVEGKPAPQRYSLITLDGSALAFLGAGAAFAPT
jgi:long-chain fatty acid transport protein